MKRYSMFCSYDGGWPAEEVESPDGDYVLFSEAEAAVKQAREDALEEAKQLCIDRASDSCAARVKARGVHASEVYGAAESRSLWLASAIESLKGKT